MSGGPLVGGDPLLTAVSDATSLAGLRDTRSECSRPVRGPGPLRTYLRRGDGRQGGGCAWKKGTQTAGSLARVHRRRNKKKSAAAEGSCFTCTEVAEHGKPWRAVVVSSPCPLRRAPRCSPGAWLFVGAFLGRGQLVRGALVRVPGLRPVLDRRSGLDGCRHARESVISCEACRLAEQKR